MDKQGGSVATVKVEVGDNTGHSTYDEVTKIEFADLYMRNGVTDWVFLENRGPADHSDVKRWYESPNWPEKVKTIRFLPALGPQKLPAPEEGDLREMIRQHFLSAVSREPQRAYSNSLLDEIVSIKPRTKRDLERIKGMGPRRMQSWEEIVSIVDNYLIQRCIHSIRSADLDRLYETQKILNRGQIRDNYRIDRKPLHDSQIKIISQLSESFVEWSRGRGEGAKWNSSKSAKRMILEELTLWKCPDCGNLGKGNFENIGVYVDDTFQCKKCEKIQYIKDGNGHSDVGGIREKLAERGLEYSKPRLSQIISSMVDEGLVERKRPTPWVRGVVNIWITQEGQKMVNSSDGEGWGF